MTARAKTQIPADGLEAEFSPDGALRLQIGSSGRAHIDRWLPFLILHRTAEPDDSLARRVGVNSPAYCIWSPPDDEAAADMIEAAIDALAERSGRLLVITLCDQILDPGSNDQPRLPPFLARISSSDDDGAVRAANALQKAWEETEVDLRRCKISRDALTSALPSAIETMLNSTEGIERLDFGMPQIHRRADGGVFPGLARELAAVAGDSLLRAVSAFMHDGSGTPARHYRSLGRSAYLSAALKADRKIDAVARSFDFLLSISPIDTPRARTQFFADKCEKPPRFHYRPLAVDPDAAKRDLYAIDLEAMEDPLLERLLSQKRREIDAQLTMLAARNTSAFRAASMLLYGAVDAPLLADARDILGSTVKDPPRGATVDAQEIATAARALIDQYRAVDPAFNAKVNIREDVAGLMVSGPCLMIAAEARMPRSRLDALLAHEISVHLLTHFNGAAQGLGIFRTGLAGYEGVQEGLGVFAEWASDGLTRTRLRLLAGRVIAVDAMLRGAEFIEVWRLLSRDHGFSAGGAFGIAARVYRSGGLAKDAIYLRGFRAVIDMVADGVSLAPFWIGKIAPEHVPAIDELLERGVARPARFVPSFLASDAARDRIARLRRSALLDDMLTGD